MQQQWAITNKLVKTMETPWLKGASVTMLNRAPRFMGADYFASVPMPSMKRRKAAAPTAADATTGAPFGSTLSSSEDAAFHASQIMPQRVSGGLFTSYNGHECVNFIANQIRDSIMKYSLQRRLQQEEIAALAMAADSEFCYRYGAQIDSSKIIPEAEKKEMLKVAEQGCRGCWFVAEFDPNAKLEEANEVCPRVQLWASNVGNGRIIGINNDVTPKAGPTGDIEMKRKILPLSVDHRPSRPEERRRITIAGGTVDPEKDIVDDNPFLNVSRSFGHYSYKNDMRLSPRAQMITSVPDVFGWSLRPGEVVILASHSIFETRGTEPTQVDVITDLVLNVLERGGSPASAAAALCDHASSYGATGSVSAQVLVAQDPRAEEASEPSAASPTAAVTTAAAPEKGSGGATSTTAAKIPYVEPKLSTSVIPGTVYPTVLQNVPGFRDAYLHDAEERLRLKGGVSELLWRRWHLVKDVLHLRKQQLRLHTEYPLEMGHLAAIMGDEADFFGNGPTEVEMRVLTQGGVSADEAEMVWFEDVAKKLFQKR